MSSPIGKRSENASPASSARRPVLLCVAIIFGVVVGIVMEEGVGCVHVQGSLLDAGGA